MWVYYSKVLSYLNVSVLLADIYTMSVEHSILLFSVHHLQLTHQEVAELTRLQARNHYERVIQRYNPTMMMVSLPTCMCVCVCVREVKLLMCTFAFSQGAFKLCTFGLCCLNVAGHAG